METASSPGMTNLLANMQPRTHLVLRTNVTQHSGLWLLFRPALQTASASLSRATSERQRVCFVGAKPTTLMIQTGGGKFKEGKGPAQRHSVNPSDVTDGLGEDFHILATVLMAVSKEGTRRDKMVHLRTVRRCCEPMRVPPRSLMLFLPNCTPTLSLNCLQSPAALTPQEGRRGREVPLLTSSSWTTS